MSKLRQKSDFNIEAAEILLYKERLYAPSVHCSYYSCFQLLKYTIKSLFKIDYDKQASEALRQNLKTHQYVIKFISTELESFDRIRGRNFKRNIKDLKQFREEADYENIEVTFDKGEKAFKKAKEIRNYIINSFNV